MSEGITTDQTMRKGIGSDVARIQRAPLFARAMRRPELGALSGVILIYIVFYAAARNSGMFSVEGIVNILSVSAEIGIIASATTLLMIAGEFDLSLGSMIGFAGIVIGLGVTAYGLPLSVSTLIALFVCGGIGALNGYLTVKTKLPSFIVTLASMLVLRGLAIAVTRAVAGYTQISKITATDPGSVIIPLFGGTLGQGFFRWMATAGWMTAKPNGAPIIDGFPVSILWWIGLTAVATWVLLRTSFGNWIFAVGGDEVAARNVGVPVRRVKIMLFALTAVSAVLFAATQITEVGSADTLRGTQKEFDAIIAVVIGGTLLTGGYGSAVGAMLGALIYGTVQIGILYTGIDSDLFKVFLGLMVLLAVLFNNYVRRRATQER
ncbi:MAG TPA: ABC transporter permease [Candidatus Cybelea sp.]|nr:ABC transporter permease [Candidatus Cybelea sp.]